MNEQRRRHKAEAERDAAFAVLDWLAENAPGALELCPYKLERS